MGVLIEGKWTDDEAAFRRSSAFIRPAAAFRDFVSTDHGAKFPAEAGRYHLYVANPCPWCHRTMIFRALKKLESVVSMSLIDPLMLEGGWRFEERDPIIGAEFVHELYSKADPQYSGPRQRCRCCGTRRPVRSSTTSRPKSFACSTAPSTPLPMIERITIRPRSARRSIRSMRVSTKPLTTASIAAGSPESKRYTKAR